MLGVGVWLYRVFKSKKLLALLLVSLFLLGIGAGLLQAHAQTTQPTYFLSQIAYDNCMVKPVMLDGQRFLFISNGWGGDSDVIGIYSADSNWNALNLLCIAPSVCDFYVTTVPQLWNDTILFYGTVSGPTGDGFIGAFNINSDDFQISMVPNAGYITQVVYVPELGEFEITPVSEQSSYSFVYTCNANTVSGLLDVSSWVQHGSFYTPSYSEKTFAYCNGFGWLLGWNINGSIELTRWNMTDDSHSIVFQTGSGELETARQYMSSNSTTLFFSTANGTIEQYYYTNDGVNFVDFAQLDMTTTSAFIEDCEQHAEIYPLSNNLILLGSIRDNVAGSSCYVLATTSSGIFAEYYGITSHYEQPFYDGSTIIIGGEGAFANLNLLTISQPTTAMIPNPLATPAPTQIGPSDLSPIIPQNQTSLSPSIVQVPFSVAPINTPTPSFTSNSSSSIYPISSHTDLPPNNLETFIVVALTIIALAVMTIGISIAYKTKKMGTK